MSCSAVQRACSATEWQVVEGEEAKVKSIEEMVVEANGVV